MIKTSQAGVRLRSFCGLNCCNAVVFARVVDRQLVLLVDCEFHCKKETFSGVSCSSDEPWESAVLKIS